MAAGTPGTPNPSVINTAPRRRPSAVRPAFRAPAQWTNTTPRPPRVTREPLAEVQISSAAPTPQRPQFSHVYQILAAFNRNEGRGQNLFVTQEANTEALQFRYYTGHRQRILSNEPPVASQGFAADMHSLQNETLSANVSRPYANFIFNKNTGDLTVSYQGLSKMHAQDAIVTGLQMQTRTCRAQTADQKVELKLNHLGNDLNNLAIALFYFLGTPDSMHIHRFTLPEIPASNQLVQQLIELSTRNYPGILPRIHQLFSVPANSVVQNNNNDSPAEGNDTVANDISSPQAPGGTPTAPLPTPLAHQTATAFRQAAAAAQSAPTEAPHGTSV